MKNEEVKKLVEKTLSEKLNLILSRIDRFQNSVLSQIENMKHLDELMKFEVPKEMLEESGGGEGEVARIHAAMKKITMAANQSNLINLLLDGIVNFCDRAALFLVRDDKLVGWQGKGFSGKKGEISDDEIKKIFFSLSANTILKYVMERKGPYSGHAYSQPDDFLLFNRFGGDKPETIFVLPFFVKGKPQAVIYTDVIRSRSISQKEIEILACVGEMSLELLPMRQKILSRVKTHEYVETPEPESVEELNLDMEKTTTPTRESDPQRLARVIINDIYLYNQKLIEDGRRNHNLYDVLKETLLQAKEAYQRKFSDMTFFEEQLINVLAKGDRRSLKGYQFEVFK